ncbi:MAG: RraA family protein [Spirochaetaceae bacterium]|nr:MAG: RraA family protein [Spirochaetaceae bacterium]
MKLDKLLAERSPRDLTEHPIPLAQMCERYERLYSGAINDVLREHNLLDQALPHNILPLREDMVVAGDAFTIKGAPTLEINDDMRIRGQMLDAIPQNSVAIWDTSGDNQSAQWGEVMTMTAKRAGCRGAIVDGGVRDTRQVLSQQFPVWVRYRTSSAMMGRFRITGWGIPIAIGGVAIFPGDIVFADIDGALVVPRSLAYEVLTRAEEIVVGEEDIKQWVNDGVSVNDVIDRGGYF